MTPEREAQMRGAFESTHKGFDLTQDSNGEYVHGSTSMLWNEWLACARALGPMVRDGERYRFIKRKRLILAGGADMGWPIAPFGDRCDELIDAAMSAALEEEKNANQ